MAEVKEQRKRNIMQQEQRSGLNPEIRMRSNSLAEGEHRLLHNIQEERRKLYATMLERQSQLERKYLNDQKIKERHEQSEQLIQLKNRRQEQVLGERKVHSQHKMESAQQRRVAQRQEHQAVLVQSHRQVEEKSQQVLLRHRQSLRDKLEAKRIQEEKHL